MTAKEWCEKHNPKLIATGKTEAKAWQAAKEYILEKTAKTFANPE